MTTDLQGRVERGFEAVRDAFAANFAEHGEIGAAFCLYKDGKPVVDVWVNAGSDRPVRCRLATRDAVTFDLVWLPATEANLAQLTAVVPDGFAMAVTDRS
jgi:hypothetical protein